MGRTGRWSDSYPWHPLNGGARIMMPFTGSSDTAASSVEGRSFAFRAVDGTGATTEGVLHARSRAEALTLLAGRGSFPTELRPIASDSSSPFGRHRRLSARDLATGFRTLATLLGAGLPVGRALWAYEDVAPSSWRTGIPVMRDAVRDGKTLAVALAVAPLGVPSVLLGVIRAGEAGGHLATAVQRAAELAERDAALRASVRSALAYPALLAVVGTGAVALLVAVVIPRFASVLADLGQSLPPTTRLVLAISDAVQAFALPMVACLGIGVAIWRAWTRTEEGRARWDALLLEIPGVGPIRLSTATARVCTAAAELLESGLPLPGALTHAAGAAGDAAVRRRVLGARERVLHGARLAHALGVAGAMPATALKLIQTGEQSGRLLDMLRQAAHVEAVRAESTIRGIVRLLEPALLLLFGGIVALVAAALLQAVYSVRPTG